MMPVGEFWDGTAEALGSAEDEQVALLLEKVAAEDRSYYVRTKAKRSLQIVRWSLRNLRKSEE